MTDSPPDPLTDSPPDPLTDSPPDPPFRTPAAALAEASLAAAVDSLAERDPSLGDVVARFGRPPLWAREPGFPTLVHLVLEQQVSLASAQAAFDRLRAAADPLTPGALLGLDDAELLAIGFSRQKARYARAIATALEAGALDLDALPRLDDSAVDAALTALPGIGPWTATIYRLMVLLRPDAWPVHDIALAQAITEVRGLARRPGAAEMDALAEGWRPWRAVAARILWHHYLSVRAERRAVRKHPFPRPGSGRGGSWPEEGAEGSGRQPGSTARPRQITTRAIPPPSNVGPVPSDGVRLR